MSTNMDWTYGVIDQAAQFAGGLLDSPEPEPGTLPSIPHSRNCKRPAPSLRLSWQGCPEQFCPGCGRSAALNTPPTK